MVNSEGFTTTESDSVEIGFRHTIGMSIRCKPGDMVWLITNPITNQVMYWKTELVFPIPIGDDDGG